MSEAKDNSDAGPTTSPPKDYFCNLCDSQMNGESTWNLHVAGKRHQKALQGIARAKEAKEALKKGKKSQSAAVKQEPEVEPLMTDEWTAKHYKFCMLCNMEIPSEAIWLSHVSGKKHQRALSQKVTGKQTTATTVMPGKSQPYYCELCDTAMTGESSWQSHLDGKKHNGILQELDEASRSVQVSGLPRDGQGKLRLVMEHFRQFGVVEDVSVLPQLKLVKVRFSTAEERDSALESVNHCIASTYVGVLPLRVTKRTIHNELSNQARSRDNAQLQDQIETHRRVCVETTLDDQLKLLLSLVELNETEANRLGNFTLELQAMLRRFLPELTLTPYGSSVTGFATKNSDLDLHVHMDLRIRRHQIDELPPLSVPDLTVCPTLQTDLGYVTLESYLAASPAEQVCFLTSALKASPMLPELRDIRPIPTARVPVLKFHHCAHDLNVDLSFGNSLAAENTRLLQLLSTVDARFRPLVILVRYWARHVGVHTNDYSNSLSNYALTLLVYFYLENTDPPILPTTQGLIDINTPSDARFVAGWDCSIATSLPTIRRLLVPERNRQSIRDLLAGFFIFYANLDIFNVVICPRTGKIVSVLVFKDALLDDPHINEMVFKDMVVQDPLELSHNTMGHVQQAATRGRFSEEVIRAAVCVLTQPDWSLRNLLPDARPYQAPPGPPLPLPRICFVLQAACLPLLFGRFGAAPEVEAQWHQWVVELACRVLRTLDIHYQISEGYDPERLDMFPEVRTPPRSESEETTNTKPPGTEVNKDKGEVQDKSSAMATDKGGAQDKSSAMATDKGGAQNNSSAMAMDKGGATDNPDMMNINKDHVPDDSSVMDDLEPSTSQGDPATGRGVKRHALDPAGISWQCRHKKRLVDPFRGRPVHRHERLEFALEKRIKEETVLECCTTHTGWVRGRESEGQIDRADYSDLFDYEEALTHAVLQTRSPESRYLKHRYFFIIRLRRFSYAHNSYIELEVREHNQIMPNSYFDSLAAHFQKLIGSCIHVC